MNTSNTRNTIIAIALRVALISALIGAGWNIYRHLPHDARDEADSTAQTQPTMLRIVLHREAGDATAGVNVPVQLYSLDIAAAQREFFSERRAGLRLEDFMSRRMQNRPPVKAQFDANGQTVVTVAPGRWWIHATLPGAPEITWQLPVNVAGREQTVELTPANAYTRTKNF